MPQPVAFSALIGVEFDITALKLPTDNKISPAEVIFICERERRRTNIDPFDDDWPRFFLASASMNGLDTSLSHNFENMFKAG